MSINKKLFESSDFPLVVALAIWFPIESIDRTNSHRAYFTFPQTPELQNAVDDYNQRRLLVQPQAFYQAMREVKSRLYSD